MDSRELERVTRSECVQWNAAARTIAALSVPCARVRRMMPALHTMHARPASSYISTACIAAIRCSVKFGRPMAEGSEDSNARTLQIGW